jgi:hypothetical protein
MRSFLSAAGIGSSDDDSKPLYLWECFFPNGVHGLMSKSSRHSLASHSHAQTNTSRRPT